MTTGVLIGPLSDGVEHVTLDLSAVPAESRVVECLEQIVDNLVDRDARVLPSVQDAPCVMLVSTQKRHC
jgi:hypothetical protein